MRNSLFVIFVSVCLGIPTLVFSDNYPKNLDIDIQHCQFKLWLSDSNDSIHAEATLLVKFGKSSIQQVMLDLASTRSDLQEESLLADGNKLITSIQLALATPSMLFYVRQHRL
jgi:hypothetical protein